MLFSAKGVGKETGGEIQITCTSGGRMHKLERYQALLRRFHGGPPAEIPFSTIMIFF